MKTTFVMEDNRSQVKVEFNAILAFGDYMRPLLERNKVEILNAFATELIGHAWSKLRDKKAIWMDGRHVEVICDSTPLLDGETDIAVKVAVGMGAEASDTSNVVWLGDDRLGPNSRFASTRSNELFGCMGRIEPDEPLVTRCGREVVIEALHCENAEAFLNRTGVIYANAYWHNKRLLERGGEAMSKVWGCNSWVMILPDGSVLRDVSDFMLTHRNAVERRFLPLTLVHARLKSETPVNDGHYSSLIVACLCDDIGQGIDAVRKAAKTVVWEEFAEDGRFD